MATVLYGANGRALGTTGNPNTAAGFAGTTAWTATGGTFPGVLTDGSNATYMSAVPTAAGKTFVVSPLDESALIPTGASGFSVDLLYRMRKSVAAASGQLYGGVNYFPPPALPSFVVLPTGTTSFVDYTTNLPQYNVIGSEAWTAGRFYTAEYGFWVDTAFGTATVFIAQMSIRLTLTLPVPVVTTNAATLVSSTVATLNSTIDPNTATSLFPVTASFEYGTSTSYGSSTTTSTLTGSGNQSFSKTIVGLTPSTLYHYRVKAVTADGTVNGSDQTFTTSAGDTPIMIL